MEQFYATGIFLFVLFLLLGSGVWVGLALLGVAFVGMELFTTRPAGDAMMTTIWRSLHERLRGRRGKGNAG